MTPMTEAQLRVWATDDPPASPPARWLAESALAYLARAVALEAEAAGTAYFCGAPETPITVEVMREIAAEPMSHRERRIACTALTWKERADRSDLGRILGWTDEETLPAAAQRVVIERDSARRERDDAQARVRELEAMTSTATIRDVHKALGAAPGESVVVRAAAVARAADLAASAVQFLRAVVPHDVDDDVEDLAKMAAGQINDARTILGARPDEMLSDAAKRVASWVAPAQTVSGMHLTPPSQRTPQDDALWELASCTQLDGNDNVWTAIPKVSARVGELVHEVKRLQFAAEDAAPIPVHHTYAGDSTEVVIRITSRDPALLALPLGARLALVVQRG